MVLLWILSSLEICVILWKMLWFMIFCFLIIALFLCIYCCINHNFQERLFATGSCIDWFCWIQWHYHEFILGDLARKHSIPFPLYANDTQLHLSFTPNCHNHLSSTKMAVELCVKDIGDWTLSSKLKLNQDKTELLVISSKYRPWAPWTIYTGQELRSWIQSLFRFQRTC